ncbi:hypothetical protein CC85DRAFT_60950 [Cutaneotrichosporon oleaginosum]|uniref:RRM domain-containing protein n=1 Tax=Cutaneotrichosporon oleaginosum TaxID=879819 RepID=A0A0J0XQD7_9TREE|nr:uncharacterized protein CC85DRAFT_60950 [Cutaneotrichosporon oleaginosum]KLT43292.1 hypothetical protein CC85DRAFT_60950 [Cutaneotrichosporon oleaginosum]TXT14445.1 hypothetical protein COLE_00638 [Cutaneotrichosporon oleaginosum]
MTKEVLQKYGHHFGRVVSVKVENAGEVSSETIGQFPLKSGHDNRGYAFVMFDTTQAALKFIQGLAASGITAQFGRETAHLKHQALQDPHSSNCYFADIPLDFTENDMRQLVYPARIASMRFLTDSSGNRRGTAMVRMDSRHQAEEVIERLNLRYTLPGCTKPVQIRIADSENQKAFKQNVSRSRNPGPGISNIYESSPNSSATSRRSSSFSSNEDTHEVHYPATKFHYIQQLVLEQQRQAGLRHSYEQEEAAMRRIIDVSHMLDVCQDSHHVSVRSGVSDATPRFVPPSQSPEAASPLQAYSWSAWSDGTVAPPPSRYLPYGTSTDSKHLTELLNLR